MLGAKRRGGKTGQGILDSFLSRMAEQTLPYFRLSHRNFSTNRSDADFTLS